MNSHFGLESFLQLQSGTMTRQSDVLVLASHWASVSRGLLCVGLGEDFSLTSPIRSELLPAQWNKEGTVYVLRYQDSAEHKFLLKVITADDLTILSLLSLHDQKTSDMTLCTGELVTSDLTLVVDKVAELVTSLRDKLFDPVLGNKEEKGGGTKKGQEGNRKPVRMDEPSRGPSNPLFMGGGRAGRVDPSMPGFGGIGAPALGGSDLDPMGGMMGGGMMMDPTRGGRNMGPRFDPVGPGMGPMGGGIGGPMGGGIGGPGMGGRRGGGGGRNFGDAMRPPDWDNMYM